MKASAEDKQACNDLLDRLNSVFSDSEYTSAEKSAEKIEDIYEETLIRFSDNLSMRKKIFAEIAGYHRTPLRIIEEIVKIKDSTISYRASINSNVTTEILSYIYKNQAKKETRNSVYTFNAIATHPSTSRDILEDILSKVEEKDTNVLVMLASNHSADENFLEEILDKSNATHTILRSIICNSSASSDIIEKTYALIRTDILNGKPTSNVKNIRSSDIQDLIDTAQFIARNEKTPDWILNELIPLKHLGGSFIFNPRVTLDMIKKIPIEYIDAGNLRGLAKKIFIQEDEELITQILNRYDSVASYELSQRNLAPIEFLVPLCNVSEFRGPQGVYFTQKMREEVLKNRRTEFDRFCDEEYGIVTEDLSEHLISDILNWRDL
jgi:hypothetical protein